MKKPTIIILSFFSILHPLFSASIDLEFGYTISPTSTIDNPILENNSEEIANQFNAIAAAKSIYGDFKGCSFDINTSFSPSVGLKLGAIVWLVNSLGVKVDAPIHFSGGNFCSIYSPQYSDQTNLEIFWFESPLSAGLIYRFNMSGPPILSLEVAYVHNIVNYNINYRENYNIIGDENYWGRTVAQGIKLEGKILGNINDKLAFFINAGGIYSPAATYKGPFADTETENNQLYGGIGFTLHMR